MSRPLRSRPGFGPGPMPSLPNWRSSTKISSQGNFMNPVSIAIHGAAGRMGRRLVALGSVDPQLKIVAAVDSPTHPDLGKDAGTLAGVSPLGLPLVEHFGSAAPDAVIDFSVPVAAETITAVCLKNQIPLVMATTGLSEDQREQLREAAKTIPLVLSPSMSMAVNLAMKLVERAGQTLKDVPGGVDV